MTPASHPFGLGAQEHVDNVFGAELLSCSSYAG